MEPSPPNTLNKETVRVWHGWMNIGDKEVAREAAAKGVHVNLAITFLSHRKKVSYEEAEVWFKEEVIKWVNELLERKQIYKASHILNNVSIDAAVEFSKILRSTTDTNLREYIGNHLKKAGQLDDDFEQLWIFFNVVLQNEELLSGYKLPTNSLECLENVSDNLKSEIATILLLNTDNQFDKFLQGETLWKYLLITSDLDNLLLWINIRFKSNVDDIPEGRIIQQFKKFHITSQMIDLVSNQDLNISTNVRNTFFNEFSKFGIFQNEEKHNFLLILRRLKNSFSLPTLYDIFQNSHSSVNINTFLNLLIDHCLEKNYLSILNACLKDFKIPVSKERDKFMALISEFRSLVNDFSNVHLCKNIFNVSMMLSDDVSTYFNSNPVIFLTFLFFNNELNLNATLVDKTLIVNGVTLNDCVQNMMDDFETFNEIVLHKINGSPKCKLKYHELVSAHLGIDNYDQILKVDTEEIVRNYSYCKELGYKFYLLELRPSRSAKLWLVSKLEKCETESVRKTLERKICKLAVSNFSCDEVVSSCVTFLEILGFDSTTIRLLTRVARMLHESGYTKTTLLELISSIEEDPYTIQNTLETLVMEIMELNSFSPHSDFIKSLRMYEIIVQYSKLTNIKLPELLLKCFASNNLWLSFLVMAQIYEYPIDQIKLLIQFFKSPNMLEHLTHGVINEIQIEEKNILISERDSRKYLLSKVGVRKTIESTQQASSSLKSLSSLESTGSSSSSDIFEIDIYNIKATLLQTLIRCHNSTDPPKALLQASQLYRNPFLAVIATSYEPDSLVTNWLTWLSVSCELCKIFTNYETTAMSANAVASLLENCIKNCFPRTVFESFEIFMPEHPLRIFMEFLNSCCSLIFNNTILTEKLNAFQTSLKNCRKNSINDDTDHEMTYLNNKMWIETTAANLLACLIEYNCNSLFSQILIIENLCKIEAWKYFSYESSTFSNLLSILKVLYNTNTDVRLNVHDMLGQKNSREAIVRCINELLEKQQYKTAFHVAQIENLPPDLILVKECQSKISERNNSNFWSLCDETFIEHKVTADYVVDFYIDCFEKLLDPLDKFTAMKMAWQWATNYDLTCQYELEKKMWLSFLILEDKHKNLEVLDVTSLSVYLYKDLIEKLKDVNSYEGELNSDFITQLERIIAHILNKNNFWLALKLQKIFNCKSVDLDTLKLCHSLAEGMMLPYQLNAQQRLLLSNVNYFRGQSHRRTFLSTKFSSFSSTSHSPAPSLQAQAVDCVDSYPNDTLVILKLLSEHVQNGTAIAQRIFMTYRISINIELPYHLVVMNPDHMKTLKAALDDNCMNKLDVVHDFIVTYKWSNHEIADFICEELVNAATQNTDLNQDNLLLWDLNVDQDFQLVLQLFQDNCSLLGHKIYSYASTLHKSEVESTGWFKTSTVELVIELLIRAHDCFTADCNMEGISTILKKAKEVVSNLLVLQNWKLIVRLLTGIARYTEMNYVFQILKENDQFEFLLRKGFRKDNTLKVALLEFLKKSCPDNRDLYKIVALHFALFSEVALLWEREAQNVIKNLISISILEMQNNKLCVEDEPFILLQNTESTVFCLKKAMENYIHATDFHLQGEKLTKATNSAKQAELLALQLGFLHEVPANTTVICLLNLKGTQISDLILTQLNFEQTLLLTEAYNFHVDWSAVLYEQYVVKNNVTYLESFRKHLPLTDTLIQDLSRKCVARNNSVNEMQCIKYILNKYTPLYTKYRIASELGFSDLVEDLITSGELAYLKDTIWKKGYKS